jgi:hypothetical protein
VNSSCLAVRRALEDDSERRSPEIVAHLAVCRPCAEHAGLVTMLEGVAPADAGEEAAHRVLLDLPFAPWQLHRPATWLPLAAGGAMFAGGLLLLGGVPAGRTLISLPDVVSAWAASSALDGVVAARGGADAIRALLTATGSSALLWLALSALGGSLGVRALLRRSVRGQA